MKSKRSIWRQFLPDFFICSKLEVGRGRKKVGTNFLSIRVLLPILYMYPKKVGGRKIFRYALGRKCLERLDDHLGQISCTREKTVPTYPTYPTSSYIVLDLIIIEETGRKKVGKR